MKTIQELNARKQDLVAKQESMITAAEATADKQMSEAQELEYQAVEKELANLATTLSRVEAITKGKKEVAEPTSKIIIPGASKNFGKKLFTDEYQENFWNAFKNPKTSFNNAALGEGGTTDGGYLVPITVDGTIVPLAPQEASLRKLALVITTENDIKLPAQASKTIAAAKAESRSSDHAFAGTSPSFTQVTLSAFMAGVQVPITIELAQDVKALEPFLTGDITRGMNNYEENAFVNGSGTGEPQGILTGATAAQTGALTASLSLDFIGKLPAGYFANASFLMHRQTGISFRKAQLTANQFTNYWTTVGNQDYLHGYPVYYSAAMPVFVASPLVTGAIAFGDFKTAMTIGDRGGPGISISVDAVTQLVNGKIIVLGYRRSDSRVRVAEAVNVWTINA